MSSHAAPRFLAAMLPVAIATLPCPRAIGQCEPRWQPLGAVAGVDGIAGPMTVWDPDGAGPARDVIVVAGSFAIAGATAAPGLAAFDPVARTWSAVAPPVDGSIAALAVLPGGELVVGGRFRAAGGRVVHDVARWDGSRWSAIGQGFAEDDHVSALAVMADGSLVAAGSFERSLGAGTVLARWDGRSWRAFAGPLTANGDPAVVHALLALPRGGLVVGGGFLRPDGATNVARWDGSRWLSLGDGLPEPVRDLQLLPRGGVLACAGAAVVAWDGRTWQPLGGGTSSPSEAASVHACAVLPGGDVVAAGRFLAAGGTSVANVARWDGTRWRALGSGVGTAAHGRVDDLLVTSRGELFAAGDFASAGPTVARSIARWDGLAWHALTPGLPGALQTLLVTHASDVVAVAAVPGGSNETVRRVVRHDGARWQPLGGEFRGGEIHALAELPGGALVAGGDFQSIDGVPLASLATWDGSRWLPLGGGAGAGAAAVGGPVFALAVLPGGDLVAAGTFTAVGGVAALDVARWDGVRWHPLGGGLALAGSFGMVTALAVLSDGDLVAAGRIAVAGGVAAQHVARWDGRAWHALPGLGTLPPGQGGATALAALPDGGVLAAGQFDAGAGTAIARWNGAAWERLGSVPETVTRLLAHPGGALLASGGPQVPASPSRLWRFDGAAWRDDAGVDGPVRALALLRAGDVLVAGGFRTAGGTASPFLARLATPCPARVASLGGGCAGSAGQNVLTAAALPWLGGTFRAVGTGLPAEAPVLAITGFAGLATPLSSLLPQGQPGCLQLVQATLRQLIVARGGRAESFLDLPRAPWLAGLPLRHQLIVVELDRRGALAAVTSTNALQLVLGSW